jgi:predicted alpha/beta hydrolase
MATDITEHDLILHADDGRGLAARLHAPVGEARASVVIHGATATPRRYYDRFARWLAEHGYRVLTYDYRGVGGSRRASLRDDDATASDWAERDAVAAVRRLREDYPEAPILMVGHSFGGQTLGLHDALHDVRAAVMVGVQFGYRGHWPTPARAGLGAYWGAVFPAAIALYGYVPGWAGMREDLPGGVAREWSRWCLSPHYLLDHVPGARERFARFTRPVLFYSFTDDTYAPLPAVRSYLSALTHAPVTHRRLHPADVGGKAVGHFGFFRPERADTLWPEVLTWFDDALAGRPSRVQATTPPHTLTEAEVTADLSFGRD